MSNIPEQFMRLGFARARVDGVVYSLDEFPELDKKYKHTIEIVVDRLVNDEASRSRLSQSVDRAALTLPKEVKLKMHHADTNEDTIYSLQMHV